MKGRSKKTRKGSNRGAGVGDLGYISMGGYNCIAKPHSRQH